MSDSDDGEFYGVGRKTEPGKLFPSFGPKSSKIQKKSKRKRARGTSDGSDEDAAERKKEARGQRNGSKAAAREEKGTPFGGGGMKFSEAFSKILKTAEAVQGQPAAAAARPAAAGAAPAPAPILAGSKTVQKRAAEEKAERARLKASRRHKRELRAAGHAPPQPRGVEPERDAAERRLLVTATKGVVQLFNAVARVQKAARDGDAKAAKATFVEELKRQVGAPADRGAARGGQAGPAGADAPGGSGSAGGGVKGTGWAVLQDGFGVGRGKLKDWDAGKGDEGEDGPEGDLSDSDLGGDD